MPKTTPSVAPGPALKREGKTPDIASAGGGGGGRPDVGQLWPR